MMQSNMSKVSDEDFDRGVVSEKLPEHVACCRIKGSNIYYRQHKHDGQYQKDQNKLYMESDAVSSKLLPAHPLHFAGEVDDVLYFYTKEECVNPAKHLTYTFYSLIYDRTKHTITFQSIGEKLKTEKEATFALHQPYYYECVGRPGSVIIKHFKGMKEIHLTHSNSAILTDMETFSFIVWNGKAIIVKRNDIKGTDVTRECHYDQQLCVIAVHKDLHALKSIFTRERLYLLCDATLFVFDLDLSYKVYTIEPPCERIGGVEGSRRLYLNAPCRFFSHDLPGKYQIAEWEHLRKEELRQLNETLDQLEKLKASANTNVPFESKFSNDYDIKEILGCGSGGCVFGAINKYDKIKYAVKRIAVYPRNIDMALKEAQMMACFDHASIVRYNSTWLENPPWGWQHDTDNNFLASLNSAAQQEHLTFMNYNPGSHFIYIQMQKGDYSLTSWLKNNRTKQSRNLESMKYFFRQIVSGMEHLQYRTKVSNASQTDWRLLSDTVHEKGFIHRDLKPCNILFFDGGRLKICDMGIAVERKILPGGMEKTTSHYDAKTFLYMSPEQMSAMQFIKANSDIFTLGLIFAELCIIMEYEQRKEIFVNYRNNRPRENLPFFGEDLETSKFVASLSAYDPGARPSCSDILRDPYLKVLGG